MGKAKHTINFGQIDGVMLGEVFKVKGNHYDKEKDYYKLILGVYNQDKHLLEKRYTFKVWDTKMVDKLNEIYKRQCGCGHKINIIINYRLSSVCAYKNSVKKWFEIKVCDNVIDETEMPNYL